MPDKAPRIVVTGGTSWYLWNFRRNVLKALADDGWEVIAVAPRDEHSTRLAALPGVQWFDWPVDLAGAGPVREFASLARLTSIIRRTRPDFVLNHGIKANIYGGLACRLLRIAYANSVTGLGMMVGRPGFGPWVLRKLYAFACARARAIFVQNMEDLAVLTGAGMPADIPVIRTMGSGVDLDEFAFAEMPQDLEKRVFLFVGRLQRDKGIWDFVEAAKALREDYPDTRFIALGSQRHTNREGVPDAVLESWIADATVEFPGHADDVRPWLAQSHVVVLPSHGGEGVPRVILEAASIGRPTIASDVAGCRDAVIPGETGFLHRALDGASLLEQMRKVCEASNAELVELGCAARRDAEARFSHVQIVKATLEVVAAHGQGSP